MSVLAGMVAGADSIAETDRLRLAAMEVAFGEVRAPYAAPARSTPSRMTTGQSTRRDDPGRAGMPLRYDHAAGAAAASSASTARCTECS
jgi:hypothetical protein